LVQVYSNILSNAVKYSGGSRRIEVSLSVAGQTVVTRIRDFGEGIRADLLPRIFEPFVQARPGLTLAAGLGMGLAVVRQLVTAHDGDVWARSEGEGCGSEFEVRLPVTPMGTNTGSVALNRAG
jgi:signal transduction histidine kinase